MPRKMRTGMIWRFAIALGSALSLVLFLVATLPGRGALADFALFSAAIGMPEGILTAATEKIQTLPANESSSQPETDANSSVQAPSPAPPAEQPEASADAPEKSANPQADIASPTIPKRFRKPISAENLNGAGKSSSFPYQNFRIRNDMYYDDRRVTEVLKASSDLRLADTNEPQVLIYHTHATESFCPYEGEWYDSRYNGRSTDNTQNMVAVGAVFAETLQQAGIRVLHDTTQHDYPSYNGSYANSYRSVKDYLTQYPSLRVVLDLHRDAIEREDGTIVKPICVVDGVNYAQMMLVSNCDDGSGLLPHWRENLRFAAAWNTALETHTPGITRPLLFSPRKYNQQLSTGALLVEFGTHANTLEEVCRTAVVAGETLAAVLQK